MKAKIILSLCFLFVLSLGACHYGEEAVEKDRARNQEYKNKRAEEEAKTALPEDAAEKMKNGESKEEAPVEESDSTVTE